MALQSDTDTNTDLFLWGSHHPVESEIFFINIALLTVLVTVTFHWLLICYTSIKETKKTQNKTKKQKQTHTDR